MRAAAIFKAILSAAAVMMVAGCGTLDTSPARTSAQASALDQGRAEALALYARGMLAELDPDLGGNSLDYYLEAAKKEPDHEDLQLRVALGLIEQKRMEEAETTIVHLLARKPDLARSHLMLGLIRLSQGRTNEAMQSYASARKADPKESLSYLETASVYARSGDVEKARAALIEGLESVDEREGRLSLLYAISELALRHAAQNIKAGQPSDLSTEIGLLENELSSQQEQDELLLYHLGDLYILSRDFEHAIELFAKIEEMNPRDRRIKQKLALSLLSIGDRSEAITMLEHIVEKNPRNTRVLFYLGELYEQSGDVEKAIEVYTKAVDVDADETAGYMKIAYLLLSESHFDEADAILARGIRKMPDQPRLFEMQAYNHLASENYKAAYESFTKADQLFARSVEEPALSNYRLNTVIAAQMAGYIEDAAKHIKTMLAETPELFENYYAFVIRSQTQAVFRASVEVLGKVAQDLPATFDTRLYTGLIHYNADAFATAVEHFEHAEAIAEEKADFEKLNHTFYFWYGAASERSGQIELAEELFEKAIQQKPDYADAHNYIAYMLAESGVRLEKAFDHVDVALAIEPDNPAFIDTLGWIYYKTGRFDEALQEIQRAHELLPDDITITEHLGDVYAALENLALAREWWEKALSMDPSSTNLAQKLENQDQTTDQPAVEELPREEEKSIDQPSSPEPGDDANSSLAPTGPEEAPSPEPETPVP